MGAFFELLKAHLSSINIQEAEQIVFCTDGGQGTWPRTERLIKELSLDKAVQILDYTHAKQNLNIVKKLSEYFGNHAKFQYQTCCEHGLPTGSGTIESAIRRVINLRIKGSGLFWKKEHAENIIFLRSLVLTGKLEQACQKTLSVVRNMFDNNIIEDLPWPA